MEQENKQYLTHCEECSGSMVIQEGGEAFRCPCWERRNPATRGPKCSRCDDLLVFQEVAEDGSMIESLCVCSVL
jgi:hypothetical protein